jgi:hypothetical protein
MAFLSKRHRRPCLRVGAGTTKVPLYETRSLILAERFVDSEIGAPLEIMPSAAGDDAPACSAPPGGGQHHAPGRTTIDGAGYKLRVSEPAENRFKPRVATERTWVLSRKATHRGAGG